MYVINKQLIIDVFGVCAKGYVEDPKRVGNKSLLVLALQNYKIAPTNFVAN